MKEDNKYFPIGRACGAMLGAVVTVGAGTVYYITFSVYSTRICMMVGAVLSAGVLTPEAALSAPHVIRLGVIAALFGTYSPIAVTRSWPILACCCHPESDESEDIE